MSVDAAAVTTPTVAPAGSPTPRRRLLRRAGFSVLAVLAVIGVAVCVAEALGWPFLAAPMQSALTKALHRPVYLEGAIAAGADPGAAATAPASGAAGTRVAGGVRIKLFGRVEARAHRIEIAAPEWSKRPPLLVAKDAILQLRYSDLWRAYRGDPLRVHRIEADRLEIDLERRADGRASWQFGDPKPATPDRKAAAMPVFEELRVLKGRLELRDALLDSEVSAKFALLDGARGAGRGKSGDSSTSEGANLAEASTSAASGLQAQATGRYRSLPLTLSLNTVGVLPWVSEDAASVAVPLIVQGQVGRARLKFDGTVRDVQRLQGLAGKFTLGGPSLAAVGDVIGVTLPTTAAFSTRGALDKRGEIWDVRIDEALIGRSQLRAALKYDPTLVKPMLSGRIDGPRLLLADLGPAIGTAPVTAPVGEAGGAGPKPVPVVAAPGRVLPDREFDLPALRAMDADVQFKLDELDLGTERLRPLQPLSTHLVLRDGVLELRDIAARTADGQLQGMLSLDGRASEAVWRTDLRWSQVRLEQWLKQERADKAPPYVTGRLDGRAKLQGRGRSTAQILASLEGELFGRLRNGTLSHLIVEAAGIDLAQAIGVFIRGDDALPMNCAIADLRVDRGVARPRAMVIDAQDSVIWVDGSVSLATESMELRAIVAPRDFSPLALRTPVKVSGTLSDPKVSLEAGPLVTKLGAAALLAAINPFAAILPLLDPGSDDVPGNVMNGCRALAQQAAAKNRAKS